ncbi:ABC transporter permease [Pseudoxanthobacter sp. M-2]|uniref:ABC transporter permease n=1 Tax=Pseudoxanthobacter sp. M-2 TaxID=3078754 RepID=UPI0038FC8004
MPSEPVALARPPLARWFPLVWPPIVTFVVIVSLWQGAVTFFEIPVYVLPSPVRVWEAFWAAPTTLLGHAGITLFEAMSGFVLGSALGALLGVAFAYSPFMARGFMPYVIAANTIPVVAIAPIIIIWFGHGLGSKIAVTTFLSFFPLALNMMKGLQSYDRVVMDVFHVAAATPAQRFFKMRLPSALPYVFVGLKINVTFSVIGAIVAEFVQADRGLGFVIMTTYRMLAMPRLWAAMIISALIGILFFALVALIERLAIPWHASMREPQ